MSHDDWQDLVPVVAVGGGAYLVLPVFPKIPGKRTLAKLNAFDFVITVALGSMPATVLLSADVTLTVAMRRERVSAGDLQQAARSGGHADLRTVGAKVLMAARSISILTGEPPPGGLRLVPDPANEGRP